MPKHVIIGTAGHIDHGKSALVEALTGTHPDRLEEEKRRGITIDLGYAFLELDGVQFGFVDVPGHEKFVRNMLAGAGGIDVVLLVVAADESIKPQTREHFEICRLLGVQRGIVVITKSDLVDADVLGLVKLEIEELVRGSFLEGAAIIPVSARSGAGLDDLKREILRVAASSTDRDASHYARLPIDRVFSMQGFGTVVTGTLISGALQPGAEIELLPSGKISRIRGLHSGGRPVKQATAGQRTAVNLPDVNVAEIERGMVLVTKGIFRATSRVDARISLLASTRPLKSRTRVHLHCGAAERIALVNLLDAQSLAPGASAFAQLHLDAPVLVIPGDRFIIRQFSPVTTIGGGLVLDPLARRPQLKDTDRPQFLEVIAQGHPVEVLSAMVERAPLGLSFAEIIARTGWLERQLRESANILAQSKRARIVSDEPLTLVSGTLFENTREKIANRVERFHKENPLLPGISREDLRSSLGRRVRSETFKAALEELVSQKKLELQGELVKRAGSAITLAPEEARAKQQIEAAFALAGLAVPAVKEVLTKLPVETQRAERILQMLLRDKNLVRVSPELIFHKDALAQLRDRLSTYKKTKGERISVPVFKELTGITRKYAIPLLEYLDRERVTRRAGDERVIL